MLVSHPDTPYEKALAMNLNSMIYGVFAEIGAGQEVANWFFRASATAGTVAKTISAYDMTMSDSIYGKASRYVSRERLKAMLDYEYQLLVERLGEGRGAESTFFAFCNTVRARGYQDEGECHGWMGIRYQLRPHGEPAEILIHTRLLDEENVDQMEALGILGTNLIYAAFHYRDSLEQFVDSLLDGLECERVEVDMLKFLGRPFEYVDNRLCALQLVQSGLTEATMFLPDGEVVQPAEALYKKPILLLRGSFSPVLKLHLDMLAQARSEADAAGPDESLEICELTMNNLLRGEAVDYLQFLDRATKLQHLGKVVLISRSPQFYRIVSVLRRYTDRRLGLVLSIGLLNELFKEKWVEGLDGGLLESFGRLFKNKVRLLVYPWKNRKTGEIVTAENFRPPAGYEHFYQHLLEHRMVRSISNGDSELLGYTPRDVQRLIAAGDAKADELLA